MTARRLHGAAGPALADLLVGPVRPVEVLGAFATALYLRPEGSWRVVAVEAREGVGLPNAVRLGEPASALGLADVATATVGGGGVTLDARRVEVERWRDLRLTLDPREVRAIVATADRLASAGADEADLRKAARSVADAIADGAPADAADAAGRLLGAGEGLTPSGDDVLAGLLAALRTLAPPLGLTDLDRRTHDVGGAIVAAATERTTALSATLLWHAARGELADPARHALRGLAGRTPVAAAIAGLVAVGHRSGRDLALGMAVAVRTVSSLVRVDEPLRSS